MRRTYIFLILILSIALFAMLNIVSGSVNIPFVDIMGVLVGNPKVSDAVRYIVVESRVPSMFTALLTGAALSVTGLMMQIAFRNPLAGPSVLGVNSGASLGVAIVLLGFGGSTSLMSLSAGGFVAVIVSAFIGAMAVMALIIALSSVVRSNTMLLIVGIMVGYVVSSAISLLNYFATSEGVQSYLVWGLGNFGGVSLRMLPLYAAIVGAGLVGALLLIKPLNALLLGERYAENLGVNIKRVRIALLVVSGLLTAVTTAFCGPIAFLGLAVPHIARMIIGTANNRTLMPATMLTGALLALLCNFVCSLPEGTLLPLNVITPILGAPVVVFVILKKIY